MQRADELSQLAIGAAIEVHRIKGPGLVEEIHSKCLGRECELRNIPCLRELRVFLEYKGFIFEQSLRPRSVSSYGLTPEPVGNSVRIPVQRTNAKILQHQCLDLPSAVTNV
jgi:hypothetical protein